MIFDAHHVIARLSTIADFVGIHFATKHLEPITNFLLAIKASEGSRLVEPMEE